MDCNARAETARDGARTRARDRWVYVVAGTGHAGNAGDRLAVSGVEQSSAPTAQVLYSDCRCLIWRGARVGRRSAPHEWGLQRRPHGLSASGGWMSTPLTTNGRLTDAPKFCEHCGNALTGGRFCAECGQPVAQLGEEPLTAEEPVALDASTLEDPPAPE